MTARQLVIVACALLAAGHVSTEDVVVNKSIGEILSTSIETLPLALGTFSCNLVTPSGEVIQFRPEDKGNPDKYVLLAYNIVHGCAVDVKVTGPEDHGLWRLYFERDDKSGGSQTFKLTVDGVEEEGHGPSEDVVVNKSIGEILSTSIETMPLALGTFSCYLVTPSGEKIQFRPENKGNPDKYVLLAYNIVRGCAVDVKVTGPEDQGLWRLYYEREDKSGDGLTFNLTVDGVGEEGHVSSEDVMVVNKSIGEILSTSIETMPLALGTFSCYLVTPSGEIIQFRPENKGNPDKYVLLAYNIVRGCAVDVKVTGPEDQGLWRLYYEREDKSGDGQTFNLTVDGVGEEGHVSSEDVMVVNKSIGEILSTSIETMPLALGTFSCNLVTPSGEIIQFRPENKGNPDKYVLLAYNIVHGCAVDVKVTGPEDHGLWRLYYEREDKSGDGQTFNVTVDGVGEEGHVSSGDVMVVNKSIGEILSTSIETMPLALGTFSCNLVTPSGEIIQFRPENKGNPDKYVLLAYNIVRGCAVDVKVTGPEDQGLWRLYYEREDKSGDGLTFNVTVDGVGEEGHVSSEDVVVDKSIGEILSTSIETMPLAVGTFSCNLVTPSGEIIQFRPENKGNPDKYVLLEYNIVHGCAVDVKVTGPEDQGLWRLYYEREDKSGDGQTFNLTVDGVEEEDLTDNTPITEGPAKNEIEYLPDEFIHSYIGAKHHITITKYAFAEPESCHLISPDGEEYLMSDASKNAVGVTWIDDIDVACGVEINVDRDNQIGNWTLFSREIRLGSPVEKRLPFVIYVEEFVEASPERVTVAEGNNLHIRLAKPPPNNLQDTCKLVGPSGDDYPSYELDPSHRGSCGFIIRNIKAMDSGMWRIAYGNRIVYKAPVHVTVTGKAVTDDSVLSLILDRPVDKQVGPEDAVYCKVVDPSGNVVYDHFSPCRIVLRRVMSSHRGTWHLTVGTPGKIVTELHRITVDVEELAQRAKVITHVEKRQPEVLLTCALPGQHQIRNCKFRQPSGRVLLAPEGVSEDRYSFHGVDGSDASNVNSTGCGLRITSPVTSDLGLWRCAVETLDGEVYHGFLSVLCPWVLSDASVAASVITEPTLTATENSLWGPESDAKTLLCSIQSEIEYCYFRARNGTIYNLYPGIQTAGVEYYGAGFDAGECGMSLLSPRVSDSGQWSCHVGLPDSTAMEQRAQIRVEVYPVFQVYQWRNQKYDVIVSGVVTDGLALDYCRYVRIDGFGFTEDNMPLGYYSTSSLTAGICNLHIQNPTKLDKHPWTVVAKVRGQNGELTGSTNHTIDMSAPTRAGFQYIWIFVIVLSITTSMVVVSLATKRNRRWTARQATTLRNSFRIKKTPPPEKVPPTDAVPPAFRVERSADSFA